MCAHSGCRRAVPHAMAVAKRGKPGGGGPEEAHLAFAAGDPAFGAE